MLLYVIFLHNCDWNRRQCTSHRHTHVLLPVYAYTLATRTASNSAHTCDMHAASCLSSAVVTVTANNVPHTCTHTCCLQFIDIRLQQEVQAVYLTPVTCLLLYV
jgi:hypothetical protein